MFRRGRVAPTALQLVLPRCCSDSCCSTEGRVQLCCSRAQCLRLRRLDSSSLEINSAPVIGCTVTRSNEPFDILSTEDHRADRARSVRSGSGPCVGTKWVPVPRTFCYP